MRAENRLDDIYIPKGDDYEFYITPSDSVSNLTYLSRINNSLGVLATSWNVTKDVPNNRIYFKLLDTQTALMSAGQYIYDIKETDSSVTPAFDTHPFWGYIYIEDSIT